MQTKPVWFPSKDSIKKTRLYQWMNTLGFEDYDSFYETSIQEIEWFWREAEKELAIHWETPYTSVREGEDIAFSKWYVGGTLNIVDTILKWQQTNREAIVYENEQGQQRSLTYQKLAAKVNRIANGLRKQGIETGDRVTIYMPMIPETVIAMLAIMKIGAIVSPVFSGFGTEAVLARVEDAKSKAIITVDSFTRRGKEISLLSVLEQVLPKATTLETVIVVSAPGCQLDESYIPWTDLEKVEPLLQSVQMDSNDPLMLLYTSGTTGKPKGVVHTHSGFPLKAAFDGGICMDIKEQDRLLWITDMGWMMGPFQLFASLINGATMVIYDGVPDYPTDERIWQLVRKLQVTHLGISPTFIRSLMAKDSATEKISLPSLRVIASTGEPWNPAPWHWLFSKTGKPIINYSGGTEISGGILGNVLVKPIAPISFNTPLPGMAAVVCNEHGESLTGEVGELCLKQPWVGMTKGFWEDDKRYKETYWERLPHTWVHGDWVIQENGFWIITGRSDDTLNIAGKRMGPAEYESILVQHEAIIEAAAIGVPHSTKGEVCYCFVVGERTEAREQELKALIQQQIGKALAPANIYFVTDLPKTRNMKVMRRVIKAAYLQQELGDISSLINPASLREIKQLGKENR